MASSSKRRLACALAAVAPILVPAPAVAGITFARTDIAVGSAPSAVAAADLNGDGRSDIVVANRGSDSVTVLLAQVAGGFVQAPRSPIPVGDQPVALDVGSFSGDSRPDLAVANAGDGTANGTVSTFLGNGDGTFTESPGSPRTVGHDPSAVTISPYDLNGWSLVNFDIVVANRADDTVSVLWGNGAGSFDGIPATVLPSLGDAPADAEVVYNPCGSAVVTANAGDGSVGYLPSGCDGGSPSGNFPSAQRRTFPVGGVPRALTFLSTTLSGAGRSVVAIPRSANNDARLFEWRSQAPDAGAFELSGSPLGTGAAPWAVTSGAFAGNAAEGRPLGDLANWSTDVALADRDDNDVTLLLGRTDGVFQRAVGMFPVGDRPVDIAAGIFGGTLPFDLVTANAGADTVSVLRNTSAAILTAKPAAIAFPDQITGTAAEERAIALTNTGGRPLDVSGISLGGASASDFSISYEDCSGHRLPGGVDAACPVLVRFAPTTTGTRTATLSVSDTASGSPHEVVLSGTGVSTSAPPAPTPPAGSGSPAGATVGGSGTAPPTRLALSITRTTVTRRAVAIRYRLTVPATVVVSARHGSSRAQVVGRATGRPGANTLRWNRRFAGHRARPGRYRLQLTATAAGQRVVKQLTVRLR